MLSICCGLVSVCVFGRGSCGWQTDKLEEKKGGKKLSILVLDSRAVVRKQLQEADSPSSNELGLFFLFFFCWGAFAANLVVPVGGSFFSPSSIFLLSISK